MVVYADTAFALNTALNYALLTASARLSGRPFQRRRLLAAAVLGGIYAVAALAPGFGFLQTAWFKLLIMAAMVLCAFGAGRGTVRQAAVFAGVSLALAGGVILAMSLGGGDLILLPTGAYYPVSVAMLILLAALCALFCRLVLACLGRHGGQIETVTVALGGRQVILQALSDTGNTLKDPMTNQPVLVTEWQSLQTLLPEVPLTAAEFHTPVSLVERLAAAKPALRVQLVPFRAVGTAGGLLPAVACEVTEQNKTARRLVAFSPTPLSGDGTFNALTGGSI